MERLKTTPSKIASMGNKGIRVSPYRTTGLYMELHKLDYKKRNLEERLRKIEDEKGSIQIQIDRLSKDMSSMLQFLGRNSLPVQNEKGNQKQEAQKLK